MIPSRHQVWANLEFRGCDFASWSWWSQYVLSWQWLWAQQNRPLKGEQINHSEGMLASTVPCRMSENQREKTCSLEVAEGDVWTLTKRREERKQKKKNGFVHSVVFNKPKSIPKNILLLLQQKLWWVQRFYYNQVFSKYIMPGRSKWFTSLFWDIWVLFYCCQYVFSCAKTEQVCNSFVTSKWRHLSLRFIMGHPARWFGYFKGELFGPWLAHATSS